MDGKTRRAIAERLRCLLAGPNKDLAEIARRLGVEELSLRMSVDELSPFPTVDVLTAVVAHYGVDPSYLLTGVYDGATHRQVADADPSAIADCLKEYARRDAVPIVSRPTPDRSTLRIA